MKTLADHILDILQNSVRASATLIEVIVHENKNEDICTLTITDNGCGMDEIMILNATDPFFTSRKTRKVGLGLPLLKQNAEKAEGSFQIQSEKGFGTTVKATFRLSNFDRPPLGDIADVLYLTMLSYKNICFKYSHTTENGNFSINSDEIYQMLGDIPMQNKEMREAIVDYIRTNIKEIKIN